MPASFKQKINSILKRFIRYCNNMPMLNKLMWIVLSNIILFLFLSLLSLYLFRGTYNDLLYKTIAGNLTHSAYTISNNLKTVEAISSSIYAAPEIQDSLSDISETNDPIAWTNARRAISNALQTHYSIIKDNGVSFMTVLYDRFDATTYIPWRNKISDACLEKTLEIVDAENGGVAWTPADPGSNALIMGRSIRKIDKMALTPLGTLLIYVDMNKLVEKTNAAVTQYEQEYYILHDGSNLIYAPPGFSEEHIQEIMQASTSRYQIRTIDSKHYFIVRNTVPQYGWSYYSLIPFDQILDTLNSILILSAVLIGIGFLFIFYLSKHLIHSIVRHFGILIERMDIFSRNEHNLMNALPDTAYNYETRNDEIGKLHQRFHQMTQRIQHLVNTNYINEILNQEAQIKALESQINPHFLYNTLESINWHAKASGDLEVSKMTEALGTLLRATLSNKKSLVTLTRELELVNSYITIQQIRFDDRLDCSTDVPDAFQNALIPPLTLQPLIENAIHYAMEEMTETCYISVTAREVPCTNQADSPPKPLTAERLLQISVKNSGSNFDDNLLELLRDNKRQPQRSGIGLLNIDKRIKLLFGKRYGISLHNEADCAIATITIPYRTEET